MRGTHWKPEEDARLRELWPNGSLLLKQIAFEIGRTVDSVTNRAQTLGIRRPSRTATAETIEMVSEMATRGLSASKIGKEIGKTRSAITGLCHRNGIKLRGERWTEEQRTRAARKKMHRNRRVGRPPKPKIEIFVPVPDVAPGALNIPLIETTRHQCKYMNGIPHVCCGNAVVPGKSWCSFHYHVVFRRVDNARAPV